MITVVTCSIKPALLDALARNLEATIGVPYQFIAVDNREAGRGLCSVYNEGARAAAHDIVCFVHEDVEFTETGWGANVVAHFAAAPELGAIGLAGSPFKSRAPSGWMTAGNRGTHFAHLRQRGPGGVLEVFDEPPAGQRQAREPVCTLDGVWMCARRDVALNIGFNEALPPFHFYDIDFALRVSEQHTVAVVYDVELVHFSGGHFDANWMRAALAFQQLRGAQPPRWVRPAAPDLARLEQRGLRFWLKFLRKAKAPWALRWQWLRAGGVLRHPSLWVLAAKFMFWYPLKFR